MSETSKRRGGRPPRKTKSDDAGKEKIKWTRNTTQGHQSKEDATESEEKRTTCIICANPIVYGSITTCNHLTCNMCSIRQRALYKKNQCLVCRSENDSVIVTADYQLKPIFDDYKPQVFVPNDNKFGMKFTSEEAASATLDLLKLTCPLNSCKERKEYASFKKLNQHCREAHDRQFCLICANFKHAFPSELKLYTQKKLQTHQVVGDEIGFKGHPVCMVCPNKHFYSDDELYAHLREKHEKCHVCNELDPTNPQYFRDYDQLFNHFNEVHFPCNVQECLDQKFVVFKDEFDLQAHMISEHPMLVGNRKTLNLFGNSNSKSVTTPHNNNRFRSQLSTLPTQATAHDVKRTRLEERARHYIHYDSAKFDEFITVNEAYDAGHLTAQNLLSRYNELFKFQKPEEINLLIYDLSELYPKNSSKAIDLVQLNAAHDRETEFNQKYPSLNNTDLFTPHGWGNNPIRANKKGVLSEQRFPKPVKSTLSTPTAFPSIQSARAKQKPKPKTFGLDPEKFPALPQNTTKKYPRVRPVENGPGQWGSSPAMSASSSLNSSANSSFVDLNSLDTALTDKKDKRKKKQILFKVGI
ncbi:BA75_04137T0 [Komagataella pastoris]|uniref:BA75_04137T0 n=1 Tax=Komagataella pastoris TaxID=4922 RepID=A0A1B2JE62_PICPA|nr:BA75_04137T0 [Komagataella pastoris]